MDQNILFLTIFSCMVSFTASWSLYNFPKFTSAGCRGNGSEFVCNPDGLLNPKQFAEISSAAEKSLNLCGKCRCVIRVAFINNFTNAFFYSQLGYTELLAKRINDGFPESCPTATVVYNYQYSYTWTATNKKMRRKISNECIQQIFTEYQGRLKSPFKFNNVVGVVGILDQYRKVLAGLHSCNGLNEGAVAGIIIGLVIGLGLLIVICYWCCGKCSGNGNFLKSSYNESSWWLVAGANSAGSFSGGGSGSCGCGGGGGG